MTHLTGSDWLTPQNKVCCYSEAEPKNRVYQAGVCQDSHRILYAPMANFCVKVSPAHYNVNKRCYFRRLRCAKPGPQYATKAPPQGAHYGTCGAIRDTQFGIMDHKEQFETVGDDLLV